MNHRASSSSSSNSTSASSSNKKKNSSYSSDKHIHLQLDEFHFDFKKKPYPTVLVAGKRDAGKTCTMLSLAAKCTHITQWIAFVGNNDCGRMWEKAFGANTTVILVNNKTLDTAMEFWEKIKHEQDQKMQYYDYLGIPYPTHEIIGVVVDDVGTFKKASRSDMVNEMVSNGRHYQMLMMIGPQQISSMLTPEARNGADYVLVLKNTYSNLVYISKLYVGGEPSTRNFVRMAQFVTQQKNEHGDKRYMSLAIDIDKTGDSLDTLFSTYVHDKNQVPFESIQLGSSQWRSEVKKYHDNSKVQEIETKLRKERIQQHKQQQQNQWNQYGISQLSMDANENQHQEHDEEEYNEEYYDTMWLSGANRNEASIEVVIPKVIRDVSQEVKNASSSSLIGTTSSPEPAYYMAPSAYDGSMYNINVQNLAHPYDQTQGPPYDQVPATPYYDPQPYHPPYQPPYQPYQPYQPYHANLYPSSDNMYDPYAHDASSSSSYMPAYSSIYA